MAGISGGWGGKALAQNQRITVYFGAVTLKLPINAEAYIPVIVSSSATDVRIADLHIPLATDNNYIVARRIDGLFYYPLVQWDDVSFMPLNPSNPAPGRTNQSILGWHDTGGPPNPRLDPSTAPLIARYRVHTVNDSTLIGQSRNILSLGNHPINDGIFFGDTVGGPGYTNIGTVFYPVTFVACEGPPSIGTGRGVMGDLKNHIDMIYCTEALLYMLKDVTRRANYNPHGHNGQMTDTAAIVTYHFGGAYGNGYPGVSITTPHLNWQGQGPDDSAAIDAHVYAGWTYDYMVQRLNRNGYDSTGRSMRTVIDFPGVHNNAAWDLRNHIVLIGTTDSPFLPFSGAVEVVAHEWAHGITQFCSHLDSIGEPRALDESFSDMFGKAVGFATNDPDWTIGEDVFGPYERNMQDPHASNPPQPHTYHGQYWSYSGDPYTNMGVPNKMFYLLAAGGVHNGITVQGIGIENAMRVMYEANRQSWYPDINFCNAKIRCVRTADSLDLSGSWGTWTAAA